MSLANSTVMPNELLSSSRIVLLIDWPDQDVPNTLAASGFEVHVKNGPLETDFSLYTVINAKIERQPTGRAPERVDFIYVHRPLAEMPGILEIARRTSARAIWFQSGINSTCARDGHGCWMSESDRAQLIKLTSVSGLLCITEPYIADVARGMAA